MAKMRSTVAKVKEAEAKFTFSGHRTSEHAGFDDGAEWWQLKSVVGAFAMRYGGTMIICQYCT